MRPRRIREPGFCFHITARGNNRQDIFQTDFDKLDYLRRLEKFFPARRIRLLAYTIMTNHLHLLVQDVLGGLLEKAMHAIQTGYAKAWNRRYKRSGHVFGDRYYPEPVEKESHLIAASIYIHDNARVAGIVSDAREYRWSSLRAYLGGNADIQISTDLILELCVGVTEYADMLKRYATGKVKYILQEHIPDAERIRQLWVAGSPQYKKDVEQRLERRTERRKHKRRPRGLTINQILDEVQQKTGVTLNQLCGGRRNKVISDARAMFCALGYREGIPAVELAAKIKRTRSTISHLANIFDL